MQPLDLTRRARSLVLRWPDERESEFHYIWLRDNCRCGECLHPVTLERSLLTAAIPRDVAPDEARIEPDGSLYLRWAGDGHESRYPAQWLRGRCYSARARAQRRRQPRLWDARLAADLPAIAHADIVGSDEGLLRFLETFRDFGFTVVHGVPAVPGESASASSRESSARPVSATAPSESEPVTRPPPVRASARESVIVTIRSAIASIRSGSDPTVSA